MHIRPATIDDKPAILALVPRLHEFGPPPWRDLVTMTEIDKVKISGSVANSDDGGAILVAEVEGQLAGFVRLFPATDYYSDRPHGHVSDLIVNPAFEGRGVGRALLSEAEVWAKDRGYTWLTISVFEENERAARIYEKAGYGRDMLRLVKPLT